MSRTRRPGTAGRKKDEMEIRAQMIGFYAYGCRRHWGGWSDELCSCRIALDDECDNKNCDVVATRRRNETDKEWNIRADACIRTYKH